MLLPDAAITPHLTSPVAAAIGWFYLVTNSARVFTYIPQIVKVWRCTDGAHAISLVTWSSWVVSHVAAMAYGALVVQDTFFFAISAINCICTATVAIIAARRRGLLGHALRQQPPASAAPMTSDAVVGNAGDSGNAPALR